MKGEIRAPTLFQCAEGNTGECVMASIDRALRGRRNPRMHENFTRENREVPSAPDTTLCAGRLEKDVIQKSNMYADGKSDGRALPTKCPNKCGNPQAEGMEGRRPTKENTEQTTTSQTQSWNDALSGLRGLREAAKRDKRLKFTALLHHVSLRLPVAGVALWLGPGFSGRGTDRSSWMFRGTPAPPQGARCEEHKGQHGAYNDEQRHDNRFAAGSGLCCAGHCAFISRL